MEGSTRSEAIILPLTEKFLLYGGAINLAGSVKGKKTAKHAVSDWMEIEKVHCRTIRGYGSYRW